jgi:hypothetical protein
MELHAANFKIAIDPTFKMWGSWSAYLEPTLLNHPKHIAHILKQDLGVAVDEEDGVVGGELEGVGRQHGFCSSWRSLRSAV